LSRRNQASAELAERRAEVAHLNDALAICRRMIEERDARLEKLEALAKFHFGQSAYQALRERDERITALEHQLHEHEALARRVASDLWRQTERIQSLEAEVATLRLELKRETA
jgi:chromosome segregation ATPase